MNGEEHRTLRESLGVHALGGLPGDEGTRLRAHLDGCAACRDELDELRSVLGPLRGVDPDALGHTPTPPADLGERIVARARAERPRVRRVPLAAAAAVVLAVVAGVGGYLVGADGADPAVPRETLAVRAAVPGVQAQATAVPHTWGVEVTLDADGFQRGAVYRAVVRDDAGRAVSAGEFVGTGDAGMRCNLNSSVLRADAAGFDVLDARGDVVVHADL